MVTINKKISQEYFDSIVAENLNDFGLSQEEAIEDAVNQLKSQGADLTTICKYPQEEQQELINNLKKLNDLILNLKATQVTSTDQVKQFIECLNEIRDKFNKDLSFKCLATRVQPINAYAIFMTYFKDLRPTQPGAEIDPDTSCLIEMFLNTFQTYLHNQSDVLTSDGLIMLIRLTNDDDQGFGYHNNIIQAVLKCINTSCQMCESNRQFFVENGLCENLMKLFLKHKTNNTILCDACQLIRSLLLDDDIRVAFSNSHEHAKFIASKLNGLDVLLQIGLNNDNHLDDETLANIMFTLSKLAVRNEFCQEICDKGGLKFVLKCINEKHLTNMQLLKSALSLLRSICNNDQVKYEATKSNAIELLKHVLQKYSANPHICELTCAALSPLLLRNSESSEQLFALEVHRLLVQILNIHMKNPKLIKPCCLALRNSISRNRQFGEKLLELRIEEILQQIMKNSDLNCNDEVKAVLRDLGCNVELKELWIGTGKTLAQ